MQAKVKRVTHANMQTKQSRNMQTHASNIQTCKQNTVKQTKHSKETIYQNKK